MIAVASFGRVVIQVGRFAVHRICMVTQRSDFCFILIIEPRINDVSDLLSTGNRHELFFDPAQNKLPLLAAMLVVQRSRKGKVIREALPDVLFNISEP